ncbi:hypothetical protein [Paenibacillus ferrarius]|uniref:hypothetical protein n=1 Tax=Paenibacillus ferrarius TaxID=1469647 RepID=UPI003D2A736C
MLLLCLLMDAPYNAGTLGIMFDFSRLADRNKVPYGGDFYEGFGGGGVSADGQTSVSMLQ